VIPAQFRPGLDSDADVEEDVSAARPGHAAAAIAVLGMAVGLAVLPALIGLGLVPGQVAAGLGGLVAVVGGVKLVAATGGLVARLVSSPGRRFIATAGD
jgi:hypothetical protein